MEFNATDMKGLNEAMRGAFGKVMDDNRALKDRLRELEQKADKKGGYEIGTRAPRGLMKIAEDLVAHNTVKAFLAKDTNAAGMDIPAAEFHKSAILNAVTLNNDQPLWAPYRPDGIVVSPQRRFRIRDILPATPVNTPLVEFCRELLFTNNAGPQYDSSSPDLGIRDGALKNESAITFELANAPAVTIAHYVPASRQILSDAPRLMQFIQNRLAYGYYLEEEDEMLNGTGANGKLTGLCSQATAFAGGATNQSAIDTLLKAIAQLVVANYTPTAIILHPSDWMSDKIILKKDSQGRYIFGDPQTMTEPRLWGLPVVATPAVTQGKFMVLDAPRLGWIADRETFVIRIFEQHADWALRNLIAILGEGRVGLVVEQAGAAVYGNIDYTG